MIDEARRRMLARDALPAPDVKDVEERIAIRLEDDPRASRVLTVNGRVRAFVEEGAGWRSMYIRELSDVDRFLDGARR